MIRYFSRILIAIYVSGVEASELVYSMRRTQDGVVTSCRSPLLPLLPVHALEIYNSILDYSR